MSELSDRQRVVTETWEISLEELGKAGVPQARPLLWFLSCFAPGALLPRDITHATPELQALLHPTGSLDGFCAAGLIGLDGMSLIRARSADGDEGVDLHPEPDEDQHHPGDHRRVRLYAGHPVTHAARTEIHREVQNDTAVQAAAPSQKASGCWNCGVQRGGSPSTRVISRSLRRQRSAIDSRTTKRFRTRRGPSRRPGCVRSTRRCNPVDPRVW
jgi:hypothetical protein